MLERLPGSTLAPETASPLHPPISTDASGPGLAMAWALVGGLALATLSLLLWAAWASYLRIPFSDSHDWIADVFQAERAHDWLTYLWGPHNAQRIPGALALQALDIDAARGRAPTFLLGSAAAWLLGCATVLILVGRSRTPRGLRMWLLAATVALLFNAGLVEDFAFPVFCVYLLVAGPALAAIAAFHFETRRGLRSRGLWFAIVFATLACGGNAAGLAIWPTLLVAALTQHRDRSQFWTLLLAAIACTVLVEGGLGLPTGSPGADGPSGLAHLAKMAAYFCIFGGLPWTRCVNLIPPMALAGALVWAAAGLTMLRARVWTKHASSPVVNAGCALIVFGLFTALLATLGRVDEDPQPLVATRYTPFATLLQLGIVMGSARTLAQVKPRPVAVAALLGIAAVLTADLQLARHTRRVAERIRAASRAFDARTPSTDVFVMSPRPQSARAVRTELARRGLPS